MISLHCLWEELTCMPNILLECHRMLRQGPHARSLGCQAIPAQDSMRCERGNLSAEGNSQNKGVEKRISDEHTCMPNMLPECHRMLPPAPRRCLAASPPLPMPAPPEAMDTRLLPLPPPLAAGSCKRGDVVNHAGKKMCNDEAAKLSALLVYPHFRMSDTAAIG